MITATPRLHPTILTRDLGDKHCKHVCRHVGNVQDDQILQSNLIIRLETIYRSEYQILRSSMMGLGLGIRYIYLQFRDWLEFIQYHIW